MLPAHFCQLTPRVLGLSIVFFKVADSVILAVIVSGTAAVGTIRDEHYATARAINRQRGLVWSAGG